MKAFLDKGVRILQPETTWIDDAVPVNNISETAVIHPGCRIIGASTFIGPGSIIGEEAPATIKGCQLGRNVRLKGGYFESSVFLDGASMGSSAHVRPYCLLEEQSSGAHSVGLKHTILFPFVTLGSLVNFCDCLMAGGTDRKNHSEVGSSFVHFNYSPRRHKATATMFGDVPRGVMTCEAPIFLGGQGGAAGPLYVEYGTITAAGTILRKDVCEPNQLVCGSGVPRTQQRDFSPDSFGDIAPTVQKNIRYIASLHALREWYRHIRSEYASEPHEQICRLAAIDAISAMIEERVDRLGKFADRVSSCSAPDQNTYSEDQAFLKSFQNSAPILRSGVSHEGDAARRDQFKGILPHSGSYLEAIKSLAEPARTQGTAWLASVIDEIIGAWQQ